MFKETKTVGALQTADHPGPGEGGSRNSPGGTRVKYAPVTWAT